MNVFLIIYTFGVIFTYLFMFWLTRDRDLESVKMYFAVSCSWIISIPLFLILCLVALIIIKVNKMENR